METQGFGVGTPAVSGMDPSDDPEYLRAQYRMTMATYAGAYVFLLLMVLPRSLDLMGLEILAGVSVYALVAAGFFILFTVVLHFANSVRQELREEDYE